MYCPNCDASNPDGSRFCIKCGASLSEALSVSVSGLNARKEPATAAAAAPGNSLPLMIYAGFWRRVWAYLIDYGILLIAAFAVGLVAAFIAPTMLDEDDQRLTLFVFVLIWLYTALMESSTYQATVGKLALGIKVTDATGERLTFWRATGRYFAEILTSLTLGIGYLIAAFTKRRQALHDIVARTLVVDKQFNSADIAASAPAPRMSGWAVVGIVVMAAFIPAIAILAAIAIPAYQDYTIRAQVIEGLNLATQHKSAIAEAWHLDPSGFDQITSEYVGQGLTSKKKYVESMEVASGAIVITYGNNAHPQIQGRVLTVVPAINEAMSIAWACGYGNAPSDYESIFDNHGQYTDVPAKYLPAGCRQ
jgi:uncharacterized RDD family membrane protein YckC/Tfp pilus assembly major pilin PilA